MRLANPFSDLAIGEIFETLLPDFILAFAFFTALAYAVLGKRFDHQRPAVVMSGVIGMSLAVGLVWWEQQNGLSIRNLGPLAVGFAIIILASVMYQAIRQTGGTWAGMGIALGASLLVSRLLGIDWPIDAETIQTITVVALVVGILAFLMHTNKHTPAFSQRFTSTSAKLPKNNLNRRDTKQNQYVSNQLTSGLRQLRKKAASSFAQPAEAVEIIQQIKRILPAEGWLTERMANLRVKAHQIRNGHVARLEETRKVFAKLPASAKKAASADLAARYSQLIGIDTRLERLDNAVAANEGKIKQLTDAAGKCAERHEYRNLTDLLKAAEKLQKHNSKLFKTIGRSEQKLSEIAQHTGRMASKEAGG